MTISRTPSFSTASMIWLANSPGESSVGSTCCRRRRPSASGASRSMPSPAPRMRKVLSRSSNRKKRARTPRATAAQAYCAQSTDLPVPAAPVMSRLVPSCSPPPSSASSSPDPLDHGRIVCARASGSAAMRMRGKTAMPPVRMR